LNTSTDSAQLKEVIYQIGITLIPGVGDKIAKALIAHCGGAEAVFREKKSLLEKIPGIGPKASENISRQKVLKRAEQELLFADNNNIKVLYFQDKAYPWRLKQCEDGPVILYLKGEVDLNRTRCLAMVGSRNATDYGRDFCNKLISDLVPFDPVIISGLAYGIDISSHKAALEAGLPTIGVLAHGLDRVYPPLHNNIAQKMVDNKGGLVTDFLSETNPDRENFPKRNRIIAGMCDATIVVEATQKGGALITADIANSYNRDVFALPGRVDDEVSKGCNHLIKTHRAAMITNAKDIRYILGWDETVVTPLPEQTQMPLGLSAEEEKIFETIKETGKVELDILCLKVALPISKVLPILMSMELKGLIKSLPGKQYTLS